VTKSKELRMKKILALYDQWNTTIEVNLGSLTSILNDGKHELKSDESKKVTSKELDWCDVCYAIRPASVYMLRIMQAVKKAGKLFVSTYDDDFLDMPRGSTERWKTEYVRQCLVNSDVVVTCNPLLLQKYKKIAPCPLYIILDAHVLEQDIKVVPIIKDRIRIVYAAGKDHTELFDQYIKPSINDIFDKFGHRVSLTLMGVEPRLDGLNHTKQIEVIPTKPLDEYNEYMAGHDFDIGLSPLPDTPFCNRKYFNKYIEYSKNGILGVYSRCLPYTLVVKDHVNGILTDNTVSGWKKSIFESIERIDEMKIMAVKAQQHLRESFSIATARRIWYENIDNKIQTSERGMVVVTYQHARLQEFTYEFLTLLHRVSAHVKSEGLGKTIKIILKHYAWGNKQ